MSKSAWKKRPTWSYEYSAIAETPEWGKLDSRFGGNDSMAQELNLICLKSDLECGNKKPRV